jgi:hypothetical protein
MMRNIDWMIQKKKVLSFEIGNQNCFRLPNFEMSFVQSE